MFTSESYYKSGIISSCNNINTNNCLILQERSTISKHISTRNYKNISIQYNIYISNNWDIAGLLLNRRNDVGAFSYSCGNTVIHGVNYYSAYDGDRSYINVEYTFPSDCDNISDMILYFTTMCSNTDEYALIGDVRMYGTYQECQNEQIFPDPLFFDDFSDGYSNIWNVLNSNSSVMNVSDKYCATPPCIRLRAKGGIRTKNSISTIGYENITLSYDINVGPNEVYDSNDYFYVYYSCNNGNETKIKNYAFDTYWSLYKFGEEILLPDSCNKISDLKVAFASDASVESTYIDNVHISGAIIEGSAPTPCITTTRTATKLPSLIPTMSPTKAVTYSPIVTETPAPTIIPSISPTTLHITEPS